MYNDKLINEKRYIVIGLSITRRSLDRLNIYLNVKGHILSCSSNERGYDVTIAKIKCKKIIFIVID